MTNNTTTVGDRRTIDRDIRPSSKIKLMTCLLGVSGSKCPHTVQQLNSVPGKGGGEVQNGLNPKN